MFGLAAVLDIESPAPSPSAIVATPAQSPVPAVPSTPSTPSPTPEVLPITPTPKSSGLSPEEELPTAVSTPEVTAETLVPSTPPEWAQSQVKTASDAVIARAPRADATATATPASSRAEMPTSVSPQEPTVEDPDPHASGLTLPAYLGIAVGAFVVLIGGAAYVYRLKPNLHFENAAWENSLSWIQTQTLFRYFRCRWEKAKSDWESARRYLGQALVTGLINYQEKRPSKLRQLLAELDKAMKRVKGAYRRPK